MRSGVRSGLLNELLHTPHEGTTMRKLKVAMYVSLDGVVEEPAWTGRSGTASLPASRRSTSMRATRSCSVV
jgi:hypothetical protein